MKWAYAIGLTALACAAPKSSTDGRCQPGTVCILAGTGELGFNGDGLPALQTRLASPSSVYEDPSGIITIVDYSNMRVRTINDDGTIGTVVGNGFHAYSEPGTPASDSPLENPIDVGWSAEGHLCVQPQHEGRVICLDSAGNVALRAGTGVIADSGDGGSALEAEMGYGGGLAFTEDGTLFISDSTFSRVRRVTPDGAIDTVLGTGEAGQGDPGLGIETTLRFPERLAIDEASEQLYVADTFNHRVIRVDLMTGMAHRHAGTGVEGSDGDGGPATEATLNQPVGLAIGPSGSLLVAERRGHVVRHIDSSGTIETVAGTGVPGTAVDALAPRSTELTGPAGIAWTATGDLLIAEQFGHRILLIRDLWTDLQ